MKIEFPHNTFFIFKCSFDRSRRRMATGKDH